jgi:rod shape-determining protein MreD
MKILADAPSIKPPHIRYFNYAIIAMLLSVAHLLILDLIRVGNFTPDLLLILVVWIAIREGRFTAVVAGFFIGLLFDIVSADVIGTNALAKTVGGFIAGFFYREGKEDLILGSFRFLIITFIASVFHNLVYFFFFIKLSELSFITFFLKYGIAISLYTTVFAIFAMLIKNPRRPF